MHHQYAIPPGHYAIPSQKGDNLFLSFSLCCHVLIFFFFKQLKSQLFGSTKSTQFIAVDKKDRVAQAVDTLERELATQSKRFVQCEQKHIHYISS